MHRIVPSSRYLEQITILPAKIVVFLDKKLQNAAMLPKRYKRLRHKLPLFVIKFSHQRKEQRLIFIIERDTLVPLFILDRKNDYNDLDEELKRAGY